MSKKVSDIELLSDKAINKIEHDKFERQGFITSISNIIHSQSTQVNKNRDVDFKDIDENLIIGIFGEWGFGKSSILNLLQEQLENRGLKTVYFNSWLYGSEEQVIISLFKVIIEECGLDETAKNKLVELMKKYFPLISILHPVARQLTKELSELMGNEKYLSAEQCKVEIDKLLAATANPLTIFIDDVDRLSKNEIHVLFKTLRLIASFKHVIYVVACDFDMVAKSIKENYAGGNIEDGRSYLEKIIQIPIRIPEIKAHNLLNYAEEHIAKSTAIKISGDPIFKRLFESYFNTPRDVKRFINGFRFTHDYLQGIIPDRELLIMELIRSKVHDLFEIIKIYYRATKSLDPDTNYNTSFVEYFSKNRRDIYDGAKFDDKNREYSIWNVVFCNLFRTNVMYPLTFQSSLNKHAQNLGYSRKLKENDLQKLKTIANPANLVSYFEKVRPLENTDGE